MVATPSPYLTDRERVAVLWAIATLRTDTTPDGGQDAEAAEILTDMLTRIASEPHLMTDYASRYGYLLGGLEMVAAGHTTADAVLEAFRKKYDTTPEPDAARPTSLEKVR